MPSQPQRLLELSQQLLEMEPWNYVDERGLFLVRLPGRELPYTVTIFGDSVDVMGLELALEPAAFRRLTRLHDPRTTDAEIESFRPGRALSVVFMGAGQIPSEFKKVWKAAGYRSRGAQPAPQLAANDGNDEIRPIKRSEGSLLGLCLHAVIEGLRTEMLCPPDIASGVEAALLLHVDCDDPDALEDPELPPISQSIVPWPDAEGRVPAPHRPSEDTRAQGGALPMGSGALAVTGSISGGSDDPQVPAGAYAMHLFDPTEERLLATSILGDGGDGVEQPPAEALERGMVELLGAIDKRPDTLYIEDPALALMAFPVCHVLDIVPSFTSFLGSFADLVDDTDRAHGGKPRPRLSATLDALEAIGGDDIPDEFPVPCRSTTDWRGAFAYTSAMLLIQAQQSGAIDAATTKYFGSHKARGRITEIMGALGASQAFYLYALEDYRTDPEAPTALEGLIATAEKNGDIPESELKALRARSAAEVSLYRIDDERMQAVDLLGDVTYSIDIDIDNACRFDGHVMLLRRYQFDDFQAFALAGMPLEEEATDDQLKKLEESLGEAPTPELLRAKGHVIGAGWLDLATKVGAALRAKETD